MIIGTTLLCTDAGAEVFQVYEDDPELLMKHRQGAEFVAKIKGFRDLRPSETAPIVDSEGSYTGRASMRFAPHDAVFAGFTIPIRENPGPGEYRYLTFAWKKKGGKALLMHLSGNTKRETYSKPLATIFAGFCGWQQWPGQKCLAEVPPSQWQAFEGEDAIDLYGEWGKVDITGLTLSAFDGEYAQFDHIYFTSTLAEAKGLVDYKASLANRVAIAGGSLDELAARLKGLDTGVEIVARTSALLKTARGELEPIAARLEDDSPIGDKQSGEFMTRLNALDKLIARQLRPMAAQAKLAVEMQPHYQVEGLEFAVGQSTTMKKFFRNKPFTGGVADRLAISLARNEYEGAQLVLVPIGKKKLSGVNLTASDLVNKKTGTRIARENVEISLVGYVNTTPGFGGSKGGLQGPRKSLYGFYPHRVGWWPDPLLPNRSFEVETNDIQPVWIQIYVPADIPAGDYAGHLKVKVGTDDIQTVEIPLKVTVWDFTLPEENHLKIASSLNESLLEHYYQIVLPDDVRRNWYSFILKNRLNPMTLYPSFEAQYSLRNFMASLFRVPFNESITPRQADMQFCVANGLTLFNVGIGYPEIDRHEKRSVYAQMLEDHLRSYSRYLEENGWTDKGFVYCFDEIFTRNEEDIKRVRDFLTQVKKWAPNLKTAATLTLDDRVIDTFGNLLDIYITSTTMEDARLIQRVRDAGSEVWWYFANSPTYPYPTVSHIEAPALDARILTWMNWKRDIPGLLYYSIVKLDETIRQQEGGIKRWPEYPWITQQEPGFNGDGYVIYPGPDMTPYSSIRLENWRDGIEDYEYFYMLKELVKTCIGKNEEDSESVKQAKRLLVIDDSIAKSQTEHTADPQKLLDRRTLIASAIVKLQLLLNDKNGK